MAIDIRVNGKTSDVGVTTKPVEFTLNGQTVVGSEHESILEAARNVPKLGGSGRGG